MHTNTRKVLDDLKKMGVDISGIENQLNTNQTADNYIGAGLTRTQEFTNIIGEKRRIETQFEETKRQLAAMQSQIQSGGLNPTTVTALDNRIKALKTFLLSEEYPEAEVNKLFTDIESDIAASQKNPNSPSTSTTATQPQNGGLSFTEEERTRLRNESAATGAALGVGLNMQIQKSIAEFQTLYGRFPNSTELAAFEGALPRVINQGESFDAVVDSVFKFSEKRTENATKDLEGKLAAAKAEGRTEAIQELGGVGAPRAGRRAGAPISRHFNYGDNKSGARVVAGNNTSQQNNPPQNPPQNPPNSPTPASQSLNPNDPVAEFRDANGRLPFQNRGDRESRLRHLNVVVETKPELFDDYGYKPVYGSES